MLSKAEIQYLRGEKQISKSYERKLKCLIRKKVAILRKEIPLLSRLFLENLELPVESNSLDKKAGAPPNRPPTVGLNEIDPSQSHLEISATKFSNSSQDTADLTRLAVGAWEGLEGSKDSSHDLCKSQATKFGNAVKETATKTSNFEVNRRRERDLNPRGPHGPQAI